MRKLAAAIALAALVPGCVVTAPVSFAWRSNSTMQTASTDGRNTSPSSGNAVNADKTTETSAAVSTASGATVNAAGSGTEAAE